MHLHTSKASADGRLSWSTLKSHVMHQMSITVHCCDVCQQNFPTQDHKDEMTAIVRAVQQLPDKGEKKVGQN